MISAAHQALKDSFVEVELKCTGCRWINEHQKMSFYLEPSGTEVICPDVLRMECDNCSCDNGIMMIVSQTIYEDQ